MNIASLCSIASHNQPFGGLFLCLTTLLQLLSKASAISGQLLQLQPTRHKKQQVRKARHDKPQRHSVLLGSETTQETFIKASTFLRRIAELLETSVMYKYISPAECYRKGHVTRVSGLLSHKICDDACKLKIRYSISSAHNPDDSDSK